MCFPDAWFQGGGMSTKTESFKGLVSSFRDTVTGSRRQGKTRSMSTDSTLAGDIKRHAPESHELPMLAPKAALGIRQKVTAKESSHEKALRSAKKIGHAKNQQQRHQRLVNETEAFVADPMNRKRMGQVALMIPRSVLMGFLKSWMPRFLVAGLAVLMVANDPLFVYVVVRNTLDVPESIGTFDVSNPSVVIALAASVAVSALLLSFIAPGGKALGLLMFVNRRSKIDPNDTELIATQRLLNVRRRLAVFLISAVVVGGLMGILHGFAADRIRANAFSSESSPTVEAIIWLITLLPAMIFIVEALSSAPAFVHAREVHAWHRGFMRRERRTSRRENRILRACRRAYDLAEASVVAMLDTIADISIRTDSEVVEAVMVTGDQSLIVTEDPSTNDTSNKLHEDSRVRASASGKPTVHCDITSTYLPSAGPVSHRVEMVLARWNKLPEVGERQLDKIWADFKDLKQHQPDGEISEISDLDGPHSLSKEDLTPNDETA